MAQELKDNWWTPVTNTQVIMLYGYVRAMRKLSRRFMANQAHLRLMAADVPPGWEWVMHKPPTQTMVLAPQGQDLRICNFLGAYQPKPNSQEWEVYKLGEVPNPDYKLLLAEETITSALEAQALIILNLKELDLDGVWWPKAI